jgi:hypothetical protein
MIIKRITTKIIKIINWRTQLFIGRDSINFKGMRGKKEERKKKLHRNPTRFLL